MVNPAHVAARINSELACTGLTASIYPMAVGIAAGEQ
jgi:hypothetical protein